MELTEEEIKILKFVANKYKSQYKEYVKLQKYKVKTKVIFKRDYEDVERFLVKKGSKGVIKDIFEDPAAETIFYGIDLIDLKIDIDGCFIGGMGLYEGNDKFDNSVCLDLKEFTEYIEICTEIEKSTSLRKVKVGDTIKISDIYDFEMVRDNDGNKHEIRSFFISSDDICNVVGKGEDYILVACYTGHSIPSDNYYVIKLYKGSFKVINHHKNNYRGAIYYKEDFYGYVDEDDEFVYLAQYYVYQEGKNAMCKVKKEEYYKHAISINEFDYTRQHYKPEWGLEGRELK